MHNENTLVSPRRSSRVPVAMPILVTSLDGAHFSELCETLVVNAHGCAIRSRVKLDAGVQLHFRSKEGRVATAQVVSCQPRELDCLANLRSAESPTVSSACSEPCPVVRRAQRMARG